MRLAVTRWSAAVLAALVLLAVPAAASAHPMSTSAVLLDVGSDEVTGEVEVPLDRLAVALDRTLTPAAAAGPLRARLERYTRSHIHATGADGRAWAVAVGGRRIEQVDGTDHLVMDLTLTPPDGPVGDFTLRYDVIVEQLVTQRRSPRSARSGTRAPPHVTRRRSGSSTGTPRRCAWTATAARGCAASPPRPGSGCSTSARARTTCCSC